MRRGIKPFYFTVIGQCRIWSWSTFLKRNNYVGSVRKRYGSDWHQLPPLGNDQHVSNRGRKPHARPTEKRRGKHEANICLNHYLWQDDLSPRYSIVSFRQIKKSSFSLWFKISESKVAWSCVHMFVMGHLDWVRPVYQNQDCPPRQLFASVETHLI